MAIYNRLSVGGREGISVEKITHTVKTLLGHTRKVDAYLEKFIHVDIELLRDKTGKKLQCLLIDVDACIAPAYDDILEENLQHIFLLQEHVRIGIYSNCKGYERLDPLRKIGIYSYEGVHPKPFRKGFLAACDFFQFDPMTTWMVGDNPNTDGGALGVLEGAVFVKAIPENKKVLTMSKKIIMPFQNLIRTVAILTTTTLNKNIIQSRDVK